MSVPRTTAGIRAHLSNRFAVHSVFGYRQCSVSQPAERESGDWYCELTLAADHKPTITVQVRLEVHRTKMGPLLLVLLPWYRDGVEPNSDRLSGDDGDYDLVLTAVARSAYKNWSGEIQMALRHPLCEVGPFRASTEYRCMSTLLRSTLSQQKLFYSLTILRCLSTTKGAKKIAVDALQRLHGLGQREASGQVQRLVLERPEYLEPMDCHPRLTRRGYRALHLLEKRIGDDVPWPL